MTNATLGAPPSIRASAAAAFRGRLPERYDGYPASFRASFDRAVGAVLRPGQRVLDVGSGRSPSLRPGARPDGCWYVGADIVADELRLAPEGSYDATLVDDITRFSPALEASFDLIISFQVLEHVKPLAPALENMRRYLRPGGALVAQLSGAFAAYSLIARVTPRPVTEWAQRRLYGRLPETVFPARYDRCWYGALCRHLEAWRSATVTPLWIAAPYFRFSRPLRAAYVAYEEWARRADRRNLAPYYVIEARR